MRESEVTRGILREFGAHPALRLWRQGVGVARPLRDSGSVVRYGIPGMADLSGILACGRRLEIEVKATGGRLHRDQVRWRDMIERWNGLHVTASDRDHVICALVVHWGECSVCSARAMEAEA